MWCARNLAKMNVFLKFIFLFAFVNELRTQSVIWEEQNDAPASIPVPRTKTLAELYKEYFEIEKTLWERIDNSAIGSEQRKLETSAAIAAIHKEVFFAVTFEMPSYWRSYLILGIEGLRENLSIINATLDENYAYLYDADDDRVTLDVVKIDDWTRETMFQRLRNSIDALFDITSHSENVLRHIQRVRVVGARARPCRSVCDELIFHFCFLFSLLPYLSRRFVGSKMLHTICHVRDIGTASGARILCKCGQSNVARTRNVTTGIYVASVA